MANKDIHSPEDLKAGVEVDLGMLGVLRTAADAVSILHGLPWAIAEICEGNDAQYGE